MVRGADVHDIDVGRCDQRLGVGEASIGPERPGRLPGAPHRRGGNSDQPGTGAAGGMGVDGSDEAGAGHGDTQRAVVGGGIVGRAGTGRGALVACEHLGRLPHGVLFATHL